jgi:hypothetical protein
MDPDIKFPECEKQYECDVRAEMLKGQTMSDNTDDMNDFVLLAIARDEAVSRVKELEAKLAKAVDALEFYAEVDNYEDQHRPEDCGCCYYLHDAEIKEDEGARARTTLTELTGGKDE